MEQDKTIVVHTYPSVQEASMALDKLENAGFKGFLKNENVMGLDPVAGTEVHIFEKDMEAAVALLEL